MDTIAVTPILTAAAAFVWTMAGVELAQQDSTRARQTAQVLVYGAAALFFEACLPSFGGLPVAAILTVLALRVMLDGKAATPHTAQRSDAALTIPTPPPATEQNATEGVSTSAAMRDLRNPLTSMLAAIDAARTRDDQHRSLQQLRAYGRQLASAMTDIDDLQDLLRNELELAEDTFDLHQVLSNCIDELAPVAIEREVLLRYDPSPTLPRWAVGDPARVRQLFSRVLQLATNRCTLGPVDISASSDEKDIHLVLLNVHAGVEDADSLGWTLAMGLAKAMEGQLRLRARPDGGTEYHVSFPHTPAPAWEIELLDQDLAEDVDEVLQHHRVQGDVLLITDHRDHQQLFSRLLEDVGADATTAATGELALHMLAERPFDLILLDLDGDALRKLETAADVRRSAADVPLLGLTSDRGAAFHERSLAAGCNGILHKPVDVELLRGAVAMHLAAAN